MSVAQLLNLRAMPFGKKGFFFYIELLVVIILVTLIWMEFPVSQQTYLDAAEQENLRYMGYTSLKALDVIGLMPLYINQTNFTASNFSKLDIYIRYSLPTTVLTSIEYIINETTCYNASGSVGACGINTTLADTTTVFYTFTNITVPVSIKLYLKNVFGGHV